jgi:hypothetical protein
VEDSPANLIYPFTPMEWGEQIQRECFPQNSI